MKCFGIKLVVVGLLFGIIVGTATYKPSIESATYYDLIEVPGIGHDTAVDIQRFCEVWENVKVDELENIDGVGPIRLRSLKEKYK